MFGSHAKPSLADTILEVVGDRTVRAIVLTHGHDDHIDQALEVARRTGATTYLHPEDRMLWDRVHQEAPGAELRELPGCRTRELWGIGTRAGEQALERQRFVVFGAAVRSGRVF